MYCACHLPHRLLILAFTAILSMVSARDWNNAPGYRWASLDVPKNGKTGFTQILSAQTGISFSNHLSEAQLEKNRILENGSGVALGDVDGDGWCDIYFCALEGGNKLYRNLGNWRFEEITESAGVRCAGQFSTGAVFADVDGDGDLDLLVNCIGGGTRLFINDGHGHFTENNNSGLFRRFGSHSLALADIDGDGFLDLYVANYRASTFKDMDSSTTIRLRNVNGKFKVPPEYAEQFIVARVPAGDALVEVGEPDALYLNNHQGSFQPVSWTNGAFMDEAGKSLSAPVRDWGLSAMFRDLNGDGVPDLYVCNDFFSPDRIWINDGHGRFHAIPTLAIRHTSTFSMSVDFADVDRDGRDDILVSDMTSSRHERRLMQLAGMDPYSITIGQFTDRPQLDRTVLQWNRGDGTYAEIAHYAGLEDSEWNWSVAFLDVDLDGFEDILATTGHMFDTQDLDAQARIQALRPFPCV